MQVDDYVKNCIRRGDAGSKLLAALVACTLHVSPNVKIVEEGMNGVAVLNPPPEDHVCVVHTLPGDHHISDLRKYTHSVIDNIVAKAQEHGLTPAGIADVVDASEGKKREVTIIGKALAERAMHYRVPILNGELAILGSRVNCVANINATMVSYAPRNNPLVQDALLHHGGIQTDRTGVVFAVFDPEGKLIYMNSDGTGTKPEFYERLYELHAKRKRGEMLPLSRALYDDTAMRVDDLIKIGATARVSSSVLEMNRRLPSHILYEMLEDAREIGASMGFHYILQPVIEGNRLKAYKDGAFTYNLSGSSVSTIDEEMLRNPFVPHIGDYLIAVHKLKANPRSNGITDKRKAAFAALGADWHRTPMGKMMMEYLAEPSAVLYPLFKRLQEEGLATKTTHMSGGAFDGKLARWVRANKLFIELTDLYSPDPRELMLAGMKLTDAHTAYGKFPMGNDGFFCTTMPEEAIRRVKATGEYEAKVAGRFEHRSNRYGVLIHACNGAKVYFSGK